MAEVPEPRRVVQGEDGHLRSDHHDSGNSGGRRHCGRRGQADHDVLCKDNTVNVLYFAGTHFRGFVKMD